MKRTILGFHQDERGDWEAELSCLHSQHVRHKPPFQLAAWVNDDAERATRVGSSLDCPLCDRAELPDGLQVVGSTDVWDEQSAPVALRRRHRVAAGTWGLLRVHGGELRFRAETEPPLDVVVRPDVHQAIPPEVEHHIELLGEVRFSVEFLRR